MSALPENLTSRPKGGSRKDTRFLNRRVSPRRYFLATVYNTPPHAGGSPPPAHVAWSRFSESLIYWCYGQGTQSNSWLVHTLGVIICDLHRALGRLLARDSV